MKIRYALLASVIAAASSAYGQDGIGVDVTPQRQIEQNMINDLKTIERSRPSRCAESRGRAQSSGATAADTAGAIRRRACQDTSGCPNRGCKEPASRCLFELQLVEVSRRSLIGLMGFDPLYKM